MKDKLLEFFYPMVVKRYAKSFEIRIRFFISLCFSSSFFFIISGGKLPHSILLSVISFLAVEIGTMIIMPLFYMKRK